MREIRQASSSVQPNPKKPRRRFRFWFIVIVVVLFGFGILIGSRAVILAQKILDHGDGPMSFGEFFLAADKQLTGESEGEIRILLLGIGGENHQGGTLTDTMILATIKPKTEESPMLISLISIPRDLVVDIPGYDYRKINSAYAYGELEKEGKGAEMAIQAVESVFDKDIPYYAVVDFQGFVKVIDDLGGITVDVPVTFTDYRYPNKQKGYLPPVTFEKGVQQMDGETALIYVRSRHGNNSQGSDFARARRQQQVLREVGEKLRDLNLLTNLGLINRLLDNVAENFRTNLELHELKGFMT